MLGLCSAVIFLASIAHAATAKPNPRGIDLTSNPFGRRSLTTGRITCVEPGSSKGSTFTLSSASSEDGSNISANGEDFLQAEIDLDAATTGSVNIEYQLHRHWYQPLFWSQTRHLAATPPGEYCRHLGPSSSNYAWLQGTESTTAIVEDSTLAGDLCMLASSGSSGTRYAPTQLWRFEPSTQRLIPHWVNPDGSTPEMHVYHRKISTGTVFGITGNISATKRQYGWEIRECVLKFNPI